MYPHVLRPGTIGTLPLANRVVMGAMHLNLEALDDGGAALAAFYAERARGGAGLLVTGGSAVNETGAGGPGYSLVNDPAHGDALARVAAAVHREGGRIALQLFHAGRYALLDDRTPLAPSAVHSRFSGTTPRAMTSSEIASTAADFASGARRARELGFDAVELMGSEGYLLNQFLAPLTNRRTDAWGGDAERRRRFPLEVLDAVRDAVGADFPVLYRTSGADLVEGGTPQEEAEAFCVALAEHGADAVDVGVGWHESRVPTVQAVVPPGAWARYAESVRKALHAAGHGRVPVIASNRVNRLEQAEELVRGGLDFVSMARPFLADPQIVAKSRAGRTELVVPCLGCNEACIDRSFGTERVSCLVNPRAGHELDFPERSSAAPRRFAVVGAGPAGLEAARALAALGHRVEVFEAAAEAGGQFTLARRVPGKEDFGTAIRTWETELARLGVRLHLRRRIGLGDAPVLRGFDGAVLATGVTPRLPTLPGWARARLLTYAEAFAAPEELGERVLVLGGGGIAVDLAHWLTSPQRPRTAEEFLTAHGLADGPRPEPASRSVTVARRGRRIGAGMGPSTRWAVVGELRSRGVELLTGVTYHEVTPDGVLLTDAEGTRRLVPADTVVTALGQERERSPLPALRAAGVPYEVVGGAADAAGLTAVRATAEALRAAHRLAAEPVPSG